MRSENCMDEKKVLLMLSGGRDSFLAACRLIGEGHIVHVITYDNGHLSNIHAVDELVGRLQARFGDSKIISGGIHPIAQNIKPMLEKVMYKEPIELVKKYPHLLFSQVNCLACHTVMYLYSIAYCRVNDIQLIAEGAREEQMFFIELPEMKERYEALCGQYGISLKLPVYGLNSDIERKMELANWGFVPKSYEPQCWIGCPMMQALTKEQRVDLAKYYDNEMEPLFNDIIEKILKVMQVNYCLEHSSKSYV